jgi:hypothetical protein
VAKPVNPAEIKSFLYDDAPELPVLDRSTLEQYGSETACPFKAVAIEQQRIKVVGQIATGGEEGHQALSRTIGEYIDSWAGLVDMRDGMRAGDVRERLEAEAIAARPDVQPDVLDALRPSMWQLATLIASIRPQNILGYDGGESREKSGQLAMDLSGVRVTSELDLLYQGPAPGLLHEHDWKTGWTLHSATAVADSFQFQMHAALVFHNYPECQELEVTIWDTRRNLRIRPVVFAREDDPAYRARISQAVGYRMQWIDAPMAWPSIEKCTGCPAAIFCPAADDAIRATSSEPPILLEQYIAVTARAAQLEAALKAVVEQTKEPVICGDDRFGPHKKTDRAPQMQLYSVAPKEKVSRRKKAESEASE